MEVTCADGAGSLKAGQSLLTHSALNTQRHIPLLQPRSLDVQASNSTSLLLKVKLFNFSLFHNLGRCASFENKVKPGFFSFKYLFLQLFIFISIPNHFLYHNFILTLAGLQPRPVNKYFQVWSERSWFHIHLDVFKKKWMIL